MNSNKLRQVMSCGEARLTSNPLEDLGFDVTQCGHCELPTLEDDLCEIITQDGKTIEWICQDCYEVWITEDGTRATR